MKFNKTILAAMAVVLPLSAGIGSAFSYFTANAGSQGRLEVEIGPPDTEITERFGDWTKHVTVTNVGEVPVYVRVQAFSGSRYPLEYITNDSWTADGSYYVYNEILPPGGETVQLDIKISGVEETDKDNFNVIVVYERTPVQYNENGEAKAPDWNYSVRTEEALPASGMQEGENK